MIAGCHLLNETVKCDCVMIKHVYYCLKSLHNVHSWKYYMFEVVCSMVCSRLVIAESEGKT